jgi:tRNA modification GTPase
MTPPGSAAVAVVRLAGPEAGDFLKRYFDRDVPAGKCVHGTLVEENRIIDDPVVVRVGVDVVDLNLHGGAWVIQATIELAERSGFVRAQDDPGQLDASDSLEREVLGFLPYARTELTIQAILAQPQAWRNAIDDPAFDVQRAMEDHALEHLLSLPRIAIVGPANVGKSTLANQLFAQQRSITADVPGTTRDWVGEIANIDGLAVMLVDTPGIRATADSIEQAAIARGAGQIHAADLVVLVLDASRPLEPEQRILIDRFADAVQVINRCDLPAAWDVSSVESVQTVATRGDGIDKLRRAILTRFGCADFRIELPRVWTSRQREIAIRAKNDLAVLNELFCDTGILPVRKS